MSLFFFPFYNAKNENEFSFYLKWQKEKLESACESYPIFCSMMLAIEDIFYQILSEEINILNNNCRSLCLLYDNIHVRDMLCQELSPNYDNKSSIMKSEIKFNNCLILLSGDIGYQNKEYKTIYFGTFLSELKISSMTFNYTESLQRIDFNYENATEKYNYDSSRSLFQSWNEDLGEQMEEILEKVYNELILKIKEKVNPFLSRENILTETLKQLFEKYTFFEGPSLFNETKNLTYLSYERIVPVYKEIIIIKEKIFFHNLQIDFEYALNNNVTYNQGSFMLRDVCFEADEHKSNNYYNENITNLFKSADFNGLSNSLEIWQIIIDDFKNKFNENKIQKDIINARGMRFFS